MEMKQVFSGLFPTLDEQEIILKFIQDSVDNWYTWYIQNRNCYTIKRNIMVMKFGMIWKNHPELMSQWKEKICSVEEERKTKQKTDYALMEMDRNRMRLQDTYPDETFSYEKVNTFSSVDDDFVRIAMPKIITDDKNRDRTVFRWTMIISQKETPALYLRFM